jgi:hypothetical protein
MDVLFVDPKMTTPHEVAEKLAEISPKTWRTLTQYDKGVRHSHGNTNN